MVAAPTAAVRCCFRGEHHKRLDMLQAGVDVCVTSKLTACYSLPHSCSPSLEIDLIFLSVSLSFSLVMLCGCRSCIVVKLKGVALLRGLLVQHV